MNKRKIKAFVITGALLLAFVFIGSSCSSCERACKDYASDFSGGLNRIINIYDMNGKIIKTYEDKIDLEMNDSGVVKFELNGKRYMYYNAFVEVIEK